MAERRAFEEIYRIFEPSIHRFCISQVRDVQLADDITGDVFISAFRAYRRSRTEPDNIQAWLFQIARNKITDHRRRHMVWQRVWGTLRGRATVSADIESVAAVREDLRDVLVAMVELSARDQLLIGLRHAAELSFAEIAAPLNISERSASTGTYRALARLRHKLGRDL